jgi:glycosyltransferase involved in cell wall biosynthesis
MEGENLRERLLKLLYKFAPFELKGDCIVPPPATGVKISCLINFYGRLDLLSGILHSLAQQVFPRDSFEVILVEDRGGTDAGRKLTEEFSDRLQIRYAPLDKNFGLMGYSRNYALSLSKGEYILFLDDDTVILQNNFLQLLQDRFEKKVEIDAIIPHGMASYALIAGKYGYHDPYFMTSRCTAYRRRTLAELGGFMGSFVGQEDVEFVVRFYMSFKKAVKVPALEYHHPPLLVPNFRKPKAVGFSFYGLKSRYPFVLWLMVILNCARHAPLYLIPVRRYREMGRFGLGFLAGIIISLFKKEGFQYT